eukprot:1002587-Amphidinium_carterae.1
MLYVWQSCSCRTHSSSLRVKVCSSCAMAVALGPGAEGGDENNPKIYLRAASSLGVDWRFGLPMSHRCALNNKDARNLLPKPAQIHNASVATLT